MAALARTLILRSGVVRARGRADLMGSDGCPTSPLRGPSPR